MRVAKYSGPAWLVGLVVMIAVGIALASLLREGARPLSAHLDGTSAQEPTAAPGVPPSPEASPAVPKLGVDRSRPGFAGAPTVRGVVLLPDGQPAAGAIVTVYKARSAWPEWRREKLDHAVTGADGVFQFRFEDDLGLLVGVEHPRYAGDLVEVPGQGLPLELRLAPGFELFGTVVNDVGVPMRNVRVAVESVAGDQRRTESVLTAENGRYEFANLRAGPVRLVASHDAWQPATEPAIVVGDQRRCNLRFDRPRLPPLRGRIVAVGTQKPIAGAEVQVFPVNQRLGFCDPAMATTDANGTFVLAGLARGSMRLLVRHPDHGAVSMTQTIGGAAADLTVEMPARTMVSGQLDTEGDGALSLGGAVLAIFDAAGQLEFTTVDGSGGFRFAAPLSPGTATLRVLDRRFVFRRGMAAELLARIEESAFCSIEQPVTAPTRLRGRVVGEDGAPIAGVLLMRSHAFAEDARTLSDAALQLDLRAVGSQFVRAVGSQVVQLFGSDRDEALGVSAADGTFELRCDKAGPMLLRLTSPGHGSLLQRVVVPADAGVVQLGEHVLAKGYRLEGRVLRGSRPLTGALVTASSETGQGQAVTEADGSFAIDGLAAGSYRVVARLPSLPNGTRERDVSVGPQSREPAILVLDPGRTVRGVVSGSDGQPLAGVFVGVRGAGASTTTTDVNGDFLLDLPDRAVDLQLSFGDRGRMRTVPVPLGQERVDVTLDTPPTCTLVAQVATPPGQRRVHAVLLRATAVGGDQEGEQRTRWLELNDGELRWASCPVGRQRLEIVSEGLAPYAAVRDLVAAEVHQLGEVLLEPGALVRGVVQDEEGRAIAGAAVLLGEETDFDVIEAATTTGADGAFELRGVSSRSPRVVVRALGWATRSVELDLPGDVLAAKPLAIRLERGATVEVSVPPDLARDTGLVQLRRNGHVLAAAVLDEQGHATFANRSAGAYTLELYGSRTSPKAVTVPPATALVRVRLP